MNAELRKIKELNTGAFTAELWIDGKLAAGVEDDGRGGGYMYRWADLMHGRSVLQDSFTAWIKAKDPITYTFTDGDRTLPMTPDLWVSDEMLDQQLRRSCRRNTLIRLKGDNSDSYHSFKPAWKFSPTVAAKIREDHGSDLLEIINERFIKGAK